MGVAGEVGELDSLALLGRQVAHRFANGGALEGLRYLAPRVRPQSDLRQCGLQLKLLTLMGAAAPQIVDGAIAHRRQQPRSQRAPVGIEACRVVPNPQESLLDDVFGAA